MRVCRNARALLGPWMKDGFESCLRFLEGSALDMGWKCCCYVVATFYAIEHFSDLGVVWLSILKGNSSMELSCLRINLFRIALGAEQLTAKCRMSQGVVELCAPDCYMRTEFEFVGVASSLASA